MRLRFGGHCTASLLISGIVKRSFRNADSGMPRISLRCTEQRSGHGPQVEVAKQTHSHTPAHDGDAEITQDLFLTKWSSIPGEFEAPLALTVDFGADHLLRFKTYLVQNEERTRADSLFADVWRDCAVAGLISTRGRSLGR